MGAALPDPGLHRVIVSLPGIDLDDLVPTCEVVRQEGFTLWSLATDQLDDLPGLMAVFGRRARIGIHGVTDVAQVAAAAEAGAAFVASPFVLPALVAVAPELPVILGGITPTELRTGFEAGAAAVQLIPTEAFGSAYSRTLPGLLDPVPVIATGRLERYQADLWLESGAVAVWPKDLVSLDLVSGDGLDGLRAKLQQWRLGD